MGGNFTIIFIDLFTDEEMPIFIFFCFQMCDNLLLIIAIIIQFTSH